MNEEELELVSVKIATMLKENKAEKIEILNISSKSKMAKFLVVVNAKTTEQSKNLYNALVNFCEDYELEIFNADGVNKGEWIVCDLQDIIVHIFTPELREKYNLEKMWKDSKKVIKI